jgi:hypothetical protein
MTRRHLTVCRSPGERPDQSRAGRVSPTTEASPARPGQARPSLVTRPASEPAGSEEDGPGRTWPLPSCRLDQRAALIRMRTHPAVQATCPMSCPACRQAGAAAAGSDCYARSPPRPRGRRRRGTTRRIVPAQRVPSACAGPSGVRNVTCTSGCRPRIAILCHEKVTCRSVRRIKNLF